MRAFSADSWASCFYSCWDAAAARIIQTWMPDALNTPCVVFVQCTNIQSLILKDIKVMVLFQFLSIRCVRCRSNMSSKLTEDCVTYKNIVSVRPGCLTEEECTDLGWSLNGTACHVHYITQAVPDVFFLSFILSLGTFGLAVFLRGSRSGRWFPAFVSNTNAVYTLTDMIAFSYIMKLVCRL